MTWKQAKAIGIPFSLIIHIDGMDTAPASQWQAYFAIRLCAKKGYIAYALHGFAKYGELYGTGGANWRYLRDLLDEVTQHTQPQDLAA